MSRRFCFGVVLLIMATGSGAAETSRRSFQTSDGVTLSFLDAGRNSTGKRNLTIALIPGWTMPASIWRNQVPAFSRRYHTLAFDPRGQGARLASRASPRSSARTPRLRATSAITGWSPLAIAAPAATRS